MLCSHIAVNYKTLQVFYEQGAHEVVQSASTTHNIEKRNCAAQRTLIKSNLPSKANGSSIGCKSIMLAVQAQNKTDLLYLDLLPASVNLPTKFSLIINWKRRMKGN